MSVKLIKADLTDAERLMAIQKLCFAAHLERYQDFETSPAMIGIEAIRWQIQNENFFKILMDDVWVGSINIRKLDGTGHYKLHIINILPDYQGKGIGQAALKQVEDFFPDAKTWVHWRICPIIVMFMKRQDINSPV